MRKTCLFLLLSILLITGAFSVCHAEGSETIVTATYISDHGKVLTASFDNASSTVTIELPEGKKLTLPSAQSASGSRYSDNDMTFWEHQSSVTLYKGEELVFAGKESGVEDLNEELLIDGPTAAILEDKSLMNEPVAQYARLLEKTDESFGNPGPTSSFECLLDAGEGKPAITALCKNIIDKVYVNNNLASVEFIVTPDDEKYRKMPIMADGTLVFLMQKNNNGLWQGVHWFLGSMTPCLSREKIKELKISTDDLASLGWMVEPESE